MTTAPFEIKVVYDASRRRRGTTVRTTSVHKSGSANAGLLLGALLNLLVAGVMYYAVWWMADPFLYFTMMTKTPVDLPSSVVADPLGIGGPTDSATAEPESVPADTPESASTWSTKTAQSVIGATAYGWLVLATASACAVALAGGAWLGAVGGHWVRVAGFMGLLVVIGGVGFFAYRIWAEHEMMFKPRQLRIGMGWLTLLVALLGLAVAARARGVTKLAAIVVLIASVSTPLGLWLWNMFGALEPQFAQWPWLAGGLGIHAVWGLVLLVAANRIRA